MQSFRPEIRDAVVNAPEFQSPTEICSHSDSPMLRSLQAQKMFQSPTEICSHSDRRGRRSNARLRICFNLLRRYAVIPTRCQLCSGAILTRFNLLRRYAVIPTDEVVGQPKGLGVFQSPTEICSHSDQAIDVREAQPIQFQSPTEICSHSDPSPVISKRRSVLVSISYGDMQSFRQSMGSQAIYGSVVSISYGDMQSFRRPG